MFYDVKPHHLKFVVRAAKHEHGSQFITTVNPSVVFRPFSISLYAPGPFTIDRQEMAFESAERWACEGIRIGVEEQFVVGHTSIPFMMLVDTHPFKMSVAQPGMYITFTLRCISAYTQECDEAFYLHGFTP